jgi:hypothetical protein
MITISFGKADRGSNGIDPPRMGHCWWFWLPRLHTNHGRLWRNEVVDITLNWLCFWTSFTIHPR